MRIKESIQLLYPHVSGTFPISIRPADLLVCCRVLDLDELLFIAINADALQFVKASFNHNDLCCLGLDFIVLTPFVQEERPYNNSHITSWLDEYLLDQLPDPLDKITSILDTDLHFNFNEEDRGLVPQSHLYSLDA